MVNKRKSHKREPFLRKHAILAELVFKEDNENIGKYSHHYNRRTENYHKLIKLARKEIGYAKTTNDCDIFASLYRIWRVM